MNAEFCGQDYNQISSDVGRLYKMFLTEYIHQRAEGLFTEGQMRELGVKADTLVMPIDGLKWHPKLMGHNYPVPSSGAYHVFILKNDSP